MEKTKRKKGSSTSGDQQSLEKRSWARSVAISVAVVGVGIVISATVNPLFDRAVHWDWMAGVAPVGFAALIMAFRRGWA